MMKKIFSLLITLLLVSNIAHARIYILIDQASEKKFPIAVPEFLTPDGRPAGGLAKKFVDLLRKDLKIAGLFQVLDDSMLPHEDTDTTTIDFAKWKAIEVSAVVKGIVSHANGGTQFQIRLYDVGEKNMIVGKQYIVDGKNYIDAVHRFADTLMKGLTEVRGPFNSMVAGSCGKPFKRVISSFSMDSSKSGGLIKGGVNNISPSWSPSGKSIAYTAFTSKYPEIYVDGKQITRLTSTTLTPAWTPDGGSLVIASAYTGDTELYQIGLNGKVIRQITKSTNIDFNPSVSSDGRIAFASERAGGLQIFATSLGGGGAVQLTYTGYQNDQPDWAPDGSKIVFSSRDRGEFDIFVMDADGSNIQRLTRGEGSNESPTFSPDSRYVAFSSSNGGIYVISADGSGEKTLVEKSGGCINLDWGPWLSEE